MATLRAFAQNVPPLLAWMICHDRTSPQGDMFEAQSLTEYVSDALTSIRLEESL